MNANYIELKDLQTNFLGKQTIKYNVIDSSQLEILRRIDNGTIQNGTTIIADIQTDGKGTHGRKWYTDTKNNIAFSFAVNANCNIEKLVGLTTRIAEIIVETIKELYNIVLEIKKPNDLMINGRKVGGILTQTKVTTEIVSYIAIGIGINTNQIQFDKKIENIATSIKKEYGITVDTNDVITKFYNKFEKEVIERI